MTELNIGFTGTREGMNEFQTEQFTQIIAAFAPLGFCFHHGDCIGADADAHAILKSVLKISHNTCVSIAIHPGHNQYKKSPTRAYCEWFSICYPAKQYIARDKDIVTQSDILIAVPKTQNMTIIRSGTWTTVRYALKQHKGVIVIPPYI